MEILDFGYCKLTVVPVRAAASDESEIVTQLLFGDVVEVLEKGQPWIKIRFAVENYAGWMDFKQLSYLTENEYRALISQKTSYLKEPMATILGPSGSQTLLLGSSLHNVVNDTMVIGNDFYRFSETPNQSNRNLVETALLYLNAPYLWGGKSLFGIDCSAFVQNCFKTQGITLPRDAAQQVHEGEEIAFDDRQIGDIPFFINAKGIIHHVGILVSKSEIIHAAGQVRIDPFDEKGIFRTDLDRYTHHYHGIKRIS